MSANISVSLAAGGRTVMQIGCDPKHDSTRLLLEGKAQTTVLDYVRTVPLQDRKLDDVIMKGTSGVLCAEAGGPEPGIGCAGRGILTTFDTLRKLGADGIDTDFRIYDVLGDVVCGGFAVPLRGEYADGILLVTSGEFMSIYAANNIMKGLRNFDTGHPRLIGIILNSRGVEGEEETVRRFADATGTEVISVIPRDRMFADAESRGHTVRELFPDSELSARIDAIRDRIVAVSEGRVPAVDPHPLDDDQMSDLAAGRPIRAGTEGGIPRIPCAGCGRRRSIKDTRLMQSCAAYGAVAAFLKINDVGVVLHGPMSCAYLMDASRSKAVLDMYDSGLFSIPPGRNLRCTAMDDTVSIFGGNKLLEECLRSTVSEGFRDIAVITACMPGIIGDDCMTVIDKVSEENPGVRIHYVPADGDIAGDFTDGFMMAAERIVGMMDTSLEPDPTRVNLLGTSFFDIHSRSQNAELQRILSEFGLKENCRFIDETKSSDIRNYCAAGLDIMVTDNRNSRDLSDMVARRTGRRPGLISLPVGLKEYEAWLGKIADITGRKDAAEAEMLHARKAYDEFVGTHSARFKGKRVMIMIRLSLNVDWLVDLLLDLGAEVLKVAYAPSSRKMGAKPVSRHPDLVVRDYDDDMLDRDLAELRPDLLISDYSRAAPEECKFARVTKVGIGVDPALRYAEYLENIMRLPKTEGWKCSR